MKVAYLFVSSPRTVNARLCSAVLPQLDGQRHGVEVVGMFFFDDNVYTLQAGNPVGERIMQAAAAQHIPVFVCESCAIERNLAVAENGSPACTVGLLDGVTISNYPDPFTALAGVRPDTIITV